MLRIDPSTVTLWCQKGKLDASKIGREWRIPAEVIWPLIPETMRAQWPEGPWRTHGE